MQKILNSLGISEVNPGGFAGAWIGSGKSQTVVSPINGETLAKVTNVTPQEFDAILAKSHAAFATWKLVPAKLPRSLFAAALTTDGSSLFLAAGAPWSGSTKAYQGTVTMTP